MMASAKVRSLRCGPGGRVGSERSYRLPGVLGLSTQIQQGMGAAGEGLEAVCRNSCPLYSSIRQTHSQRPEYPSPTSCRTLGTLEKVANT